MDVSKLRIWSIGTVASNKELNSDTIEVNCQEIDPTSDGQITDSATQDTATVTDKSGAATEVTGTSTSTVKAKWMPYGESNRVTPPDVRRGEKVLVYKFDKADAYYWLTYEYDVRFRKLETVIYAFSATQAENNVGDDTDSYVLEFSSHKKTVRLHTSQANGEVSSYDVIINGAEGFIQLKDADGQEILLDTRNKQIRLKNSADSVFDLIDKELNVTTLERITFNTKVYQLNAEKEEINADTVHDGMYHLAGNMTSSAGSKGGTGMFAMSGDITTEGNITTEQNIRSMGVVHANKVISDQPIDAPNV